MLTSKEVLQNANYPSADTTATDCTFTLGRIESSECAIHIFSKHALQINCTFMNADICRIRLDFVNTVMAGPPTTDAGTVTEVGRCATSGDYVTVTSPTSQRIPLLCGTLTGQHSMM